MSEPKKKETKQETESTPVVLGSEFDFWLNKEDNIYDEKYGDE